MSSLIIKVTLDGISQEYLLNKLGPIIIGSDKRCDVCLDDSQVEAKLFEVKISCGNVFVTDVGTRGGININSVIPTFRHSTPYHEGECISVKNTNYQIYIYRAQNEVIEPPPFFEGEFKERLVRMDLKIREKEFELKGLETSREKKNDQLLDLENKYHQNASEKSKLEVEVNTLRTQKETISHEIRKSSEKNQEEQGKLGQLHDFVKQLENEERIIKEKIATQNEILEKLRTERENKSKEVDQQRVLLADLQLDTLKMKEQLRELSSEYEDQEKEVQNENTKIQKILIIKQCLDWI